MNAVELDATPIVDLPSVPVAMRPTMVTVLDAHDCSLELSVVEDAVPSVRGRYVRCHLLDGDTPRVVGSDMIEVLAQRMANGLFAELNQPTTSGHRWLCSFMEPHGAVYASTADNDEIHLLWQDVDAKEFGKSVLTPMLARGWVEYFERARTANRWTAVPAPSSRKLLIVEDTFAIASRGLVLAPAIVLENGQHKLSVELRRPNGTTTSTDALAQVPFIVPANPTKARSRGHMLTLQLEKSEVPVGTEVWLHQKDRG